MTLLRRLSGRRTLLAAALAALIALVALIAVIVGATGLAILCVVALQGITFLVVLQSARRSATTDPLIARQLTAIRELDRKVSNLGLRGVTESRAVERSMLARASKSDAAARKRDASLRRYIGRRGEEHVQDVEALFQLFGRFTPRAAMPSSGRWALEPTGLLRLMDLIDHRPIRTAVEFGSGTSTLWLAYAFEAKGSGRVVSLDHEPHFAAMTRSALAAHGFGGDVADVRDAALVPGVLDGHPTDWYDPESFADLADIDLMIVDGPPEATGEFARYPAFPVLLDRLAPGAIIVVDDAGRETEQLMVERWQELVPGLRPLDEAGPGRQIFLTLGT